jgi:hypothetical protein
MFISPQSHLRRKELGSFVPGLQNWKSLKVLARASEAAPRNLEAEGTQEGPPLASPAQRNLQGAG